MAGRSDWQNNKQNQESLNIQERYNIPVGGAAAASNAALAQLAPDIQWIESFVAGDKTFCVYLATDEAGGI